MEPKIKIIEPIEFTGAELTGVIPMRWISLEELKAKWPSGPLETAEGRIGAEDGL